MRLSNPTRRVAAKAVLAAVPRSLLTGVAGARLRPGIPLHLILLNWGGALAALVVLVAATAVTLTLMQFILRKGGTDPQWLWFASEPPGLQGLRAQARPDDGTHRG